MTKTELIGYLMTVKAHSNHEKAYYLALAEKKYANHTHSLAQALEQAAYESMAVDLMAFYIKE